MCHEEKMQNFFAISRNNNGIKKEMENHIASQENHQFCFPDGEFCFFYFDENWLIFGRDVFGRKSICWRIGYSKMDKSCEFQLSVLPGLTNEEWHEVPPGTIFTIPLNGAKAWSKLNAKLGTIFPSNPILDFHAKMDGEMEEFVGQQIFVQSHYPMDHFQENPFFKTFTRIVYKYLNSGILLQPNHSTESPLNATDMEIAGFTAEFVQRFQAVIENILKTVPLITEGFTDLIEVPVLFSGGVDSLMVALSVGDVLFRHSISRPNFRWKIPLFNVAFGEKDEDYYEASDRSQSILAFEQLKQRNLARFGTNPYSLILVNVPKSELIECRQKFIANSIFPSKTVLDDSIGCVLWFASRMEGIQYGIEGERSLRKIECKIPFAFVGSGSDEQLGGYARHRRCFEAKGLEGLGAELSIEMHRIGERNFGRDDRVGMSNGRAILAPFLEEPFVHWLNNVATTIKTGFSLNAAANSNKFLLRNALRSLGVAETILLRPKRAMQFGSRIAKVDKVPGQKGSNISQRLVQNKEKEETRE